MGWRDGRVAPWRASAEQVGHARLAAERLLWSPAGQESTVAFLETFVCGSGWGFRHGCKRVRVRVRTVLKREEGKFDLHRRRPPSSGPGPFPVPFKRQHWQPSFAHLGSHSHEPHLQNGSGLEVNLHGRGRRESR